MDLPILEISCKYIICGPLRLASSLDVYMVLPCCSMYHHFIPFYDYNIPLCDVSQFVYQLMALGVVSSFLAIMKSTVNIMNICE